MRPTKENVNAISKTEAPTNIAELRIFLSDFATTVKPNGIGAKREKKTFETLKNQLAWTSMKTFYNKEAPTLVVTDVSLGQSRGYTCARKVGSEESSSICKPKLK